MKDSIQDSNLKEEEISIDKMGEIVFSNVKLHIEAQLHKFDSFLQELTDIKLNLVTLSSLLNSKEVFSESEYKNCFYQIKQSFGEVKEDETMEGVAEINYYNF